MRLHRFYVSQCLSNGQVARFNDENLIHQWKKVFRMDPEDEVILFCGDGFDYRGKIKMISREEAVVEIFGVEKNSVIPKKEIHLFASLVKKNNFELILEKCTELGVSSFTPVISERSEKKDFNLERGEKIIKEACEQSGRNFLPKLESPKKLEEVFSALETEKNVTPISFDLGGEKFEANNFETKNPIGIFIGPEGGWGEKDLEIFREKNVPLVSLENLPVLRAETAAIVASAVFLI